MGLAVGKAAAAHCCLKIGKRPCEALGALPPCAPEFHRRRLRLGGSQPGPRLKSTLERKVLPPPPPISRCPGRLGKVTLAFISCSEERN